MENWKIIENSNYQISNFGNIKNIQTGLIRKNCINKKIGYYVSRLKINDKYVSVYPHRLVAKYFLNDFHDEGIIDHIDRNKLNNNVNNLRIVSYVENEYNKSKRLNCSSKYKGVSWCKTKQKWRCSIKILKKQINKYFDDENECAEYYNLLVKNHNLEIYCDLNIISDEEN